MSSLETAIKTDFEEYTYNESRRIDLKQDVSMFQDIVDGKMRAITRFNDRKYQVGDIVTLHEGRLDDGVFQMTGRKVSAAISYISDFGCQDGYVTLSLSRVGLIYINL